MANIPAPTLNDVARLLTYVAPGFFARAGYRAVFPQRNKGDFEALVASVAASVPLVVVGNVVAGWIHAPHDANDAGYVAALLVPALVIGYLVARVRGADSARGALRRLGVPFEPEATTYEQTLLKLPEDSIVRVTLKDGTQVAGYPALGPSSAEPDESKEIYLTAPQFLVESDGDEPEWFYSPEQQGLIVNLDEVRTIALPVDPRQPKPLRFHLPWKSREQLDTRREVSP